MLLSFGCARTKYRQAADREAYCLIDSRQQDERWRVPDRRVEPASYSRMYVGAEQDCGPKPYDDDGAKPFMDFPNCINNTKYYRKRDTRYNTENPIWVEHLPREENGKIKLTQPLAIDLALIHSREYQSQFEDVYFSALNLSGNRFEFDAQWAGGVGAAFAATGEDLGNGRVLDATVSRLGLGRSLPGGGQFATNVLNSLVWDFGSNSFQAGSASLVTAFTQPLLRGAFRHVRLENLTQAERSMLYSVRDFARFRRTFYVDTVTSYLNLLTQVQALRNLRTNVEVLQQNLEEHETYVDLFIVTQFRRDQVFQEFQSGRLSQLSAEQRLTASLDAFKFQLGLPAWVPFEIDESLLDPFELVNPEIEELQAEATQLYKRLLPYIPERLAPKEELQSIFDDYKALRERVAKKVPELKDELDRWQTRIDSVETVAELEVDDRLDQEQQLDLLTEVGGVLGELESGLDGTDSLTAAMQTALDQYDLPPREIDPEQAGSGAETDRRVIAWDTILEGIQKNLRREVDELYLAQTQIRLFLIDIEPLEVNELAAITYAHQNRFDLMNAKAEVMDSYRRVEVAADALQSDLSLTGGVVLGSDTNRNNAFRFDANNAQYTAGVQFDGPLNRLNERNAYRARQIEYQRVSRNFIANRDQVSNEIRSVLRQLELSRLSFQIARQQLVAATRQVDEKQFDLRLAGDTGDSNLTLFLLQAFQGLLSAKNNLIANWIEYRVQKMRLFESLEMLYLDENSAWMNEEIGIDQIKEFSDIDPEYFPPEWVMERLPTREETQDRDRFENEIDPDDLLEEQPPPIPRPQQNQVPLDGEPLVEIK